MNTRSKSRKKVDADSASSYTHVLAKKSTVLRKVSRKKIKANKERNDMIPTEEPKPNNDSGSIKVNAGQLKDETTPRVMKPKKPNTNKPEESLETFPGRLAWRIRNLELPLTSTPIASTSKTIKTYQKDLDDSCFGFLRDDSLNSYSRVLSPINNAVEHTSKPKEDPKIGRENNSKSTAAASTKTRKVQEKKAPVTRSKKRIHQMQKETTASELKSQPAQSDNKCLEKTWTDDCDVPMVKNPIACSTNFDALYGRYNSDEMEEQEAGLFIDPACVKRTYSRSSHQGVDMAHEDGLFQDPSASISRNKFGKKTTGVKKAGQKKAKKQAQVDEAAEKWLEEKNKEFEEISHCPLIID